MEKYMVMYVADKITSEYLSDDRLLRAQVFVTEAGTWGIRMWKDQVFICDELYKDKAQGYAEDAAENYVLGIK